MLSGIPEMDLGMEAKIRNIEATESAKNRILAERMKKKDLPSEFVPTNMAVNFVQHNRCERPSLLTIKPYPESLQTGNPRGNSCGDEFVSPETRGDIWKILMQSWTSFASFDFLSFWLWFDNIIQTIS